MTAEAHFAEEFGRLKAALPGAGLPWMQARREAGMARFEQLGLPTTKVEAWRYTNLNPLRKLGFAPLDTATPAVAVRDVPEGVRVDDLADLLARDPAVLEGRLGGLATAPDAVVALNDALMRDGMVIRVAPGAKPDRPLALDFVGQGGDAVPTGFPRLLIVVGAGATLDLVERHAGAGAYFSDGRAEILVEAGATLRHVKLLQDDPAAYHLWSSAIEVAADGTYDSFVLSAGGRISRQEVSVRLAAPGARCVLNGAYLGHGQQTIDNTTLIDHAAPETESREVFKGVLDDRARAVFQGTIQVREGAQKTDGHQLSRVLLLSDQAQANTKPALEILADDVKCSHGATVGELDDAALFYLQSRGIPEATARGLLIEAFLAEVIDGIGVVEAREAAREVLAKWLGERF